MTTTDTKWWNYLLILWVRWAINPSRFFFQNQKLKNQYRIIYGNYHSFNITIQSSMQFLWRFKKKFSQLGKNLSNNGGHFEFQICIKNTKWGWGWSKEHSYNVTVHSESAMCFQSSFLKFQSIKFHYWHWLHLSAMWFQVEISANQNSLLALAAI